MRGFAYGTNAALSGGDTATSTDTVGQPFSTGAFTGSLTGLTCNTTYYTRAYATNSAGTSYGSITTFTTSACPVAPGNTSGGATKTGGGGGIVGLAGVTGVFQGLGSGYIAPRPQIDYPDGTIVYLDVPTSTSQTDSTPPPSAPGTTPDSAPPTTPPSTPTPQTPSAGVPLVLTTDLQVGDTGASVTLLQQWFNANGYRVATTGPGSPGNETSTFGNATRRAVISFQKAHNLPQTGTLGPLTRGVMAQ